MKRPKRRHSPQAVASRHSPKATRRPLRFEHMEDRRLLAEIPIPNAGFEVRGTYDPIPEGEHKYPRPAQESWRYFEAQGNGGPARIVHPRTDYVETAAEGDYVVRVVTDPRPWVLTLGPTAGVAQILDEQFDPTKSYELTAQVSRYTNDVNDANHLWNGYVVQLAVGGVNDTPGGQYSGQVIGGTVIAEDWNTRSVPYGTWVTSTVSYTPDPNDADLAGLPLQIRLLAIRDPNEPDQSGCTSSSCMDFSYANYAAYDDVHLFAEDSTAPAVVGRHVFYNDSSPDGNDPAANVDDDAALANKTALRSGTATFDNYTSYVKGLNGIMVDIANKPDGTTLDPIVDFDFKTGNDSNPAAWADAPAPTIVDVRDHPDSPGVSRVTLIWDPEDAIQNAWLQVTVQNTANTGLAEPDVFYFGNAIGESGDSPINTYVNGFDFAGARDSTIIEDLDFNRDGMVDGADVAIARDYATNFRTALQRISMLPVPPPRAAFVRMAKSQEPAASTTDAAFLVRAPDAAGAALLDLAAEDVAASRQPLSANAAVGEDLLSLLSLDLALRDEFPASN